MRSTTTDMLCGDIQSTLLPQLSHFVHHRRQQSFVEFNKSKNLRIFIKYIKHRIGIISYEKLQHFFFHGRFHFFCVRRMTSNKRNYVWVLLKLFWNILKNYFRRSTQIFNNLLPYSSILVIPYVPYKISI